MDLAEMLLRGASAHGVTAVKTPVVEVAAVPEPVAEEDVVISKSAMLAAAVEIKSAMDAVADANAKAAVAALDSSILPGFYA